jgi:hypothetical protein
MWLVGPASNILQFLLGRSDSGPAGPFYPTYNLHNPYIWNLCLWSVKHKLWVYHKCIDFRNKLCIEYILHCSVPSSIDPRKQTMHVRNN